CDSTVRLTLQVLEPGINELETTICEGNSYDLNGEIFTEAGHYTRKLTAANGCDSIIYLTLNTLPDQHKNIDKTICRGDTLAFGSLLLTEPGDYHQLFLSSFGCDSTVTLKLQVIEPAIAEWEKAICEGEVFELNGTSYTEKGQYQQILTSTNGCDSIIRINLDVHPIDETQLEVNICEGEVYEFGESQLTASGVYQTSYINANGCDSLVYLKLQVVQNIEQSLEAEICAGEVYEFGEEELTESGVYQTSHINILGCDSTVTLTLNVLEEVETYLNAELCEGEVYEFGESQLTTSGTYQTSYINNNGCDSIVTLQLEVIPSVELFGADVSICEGEEVDLEVYGSENVQWFPATGLSCSNCPNPVASPSETTIYLVQTEGCGGTVVETEIMVEVLEKPTLQTNEGRTITPGEEVELEAEGTWGMGAVNWEGPEGLICQDCPRITVLPQGNSIYEASVMNDEGCLASDTVHIQVRLDCIEGDFFIPNAFSPNGDGTNESFHITAYTDAQLEYLRIYDRWGELMFETNDFNQVWDGRFRGKLLNPGVYVYYMRVKCPDEESYERFGNVTLIR
ncbi:MAG: gliding motility-associated C-terminal domain-containing protein, partial [Saprospiraceae bacterium]|nr:gliding motility-associated C-terminal domain-containing protein [Saprospiraceae bacterium]